MRPTELDSIAHSGHSVPASTRAGFGPLDWLDRVLVIAAMVATIASGLVLTYSVIVRDLFRWSTDWQDEISVFLLVGATFLSAPWVQARRGHIAIEAITSLLSPRVQRVRLLLADLICLFFAALFGFLCWELLLEAVKSGEITDSVFAPPLWFPYSLMTAGITLLALRFLVQIWQDIVHLNDGRL